MKSSPLIDIFVGLRNYPWLVALQQSQRPFRSARQRSIQDSSNLQIPKNKHRHFCPLELNVYLKTPQMSITPENLRPNDRDNGIVQLKIFENQQGVFLKQHKKYPK